MDDDPSQSYLRSVRLALRLSKEGRRRAIEEIRNHLDDGAAAHRRAGATAEQAIALAITELGEPDVVAAEFNAESSHKSEVAGVRRWLPLVVPSVLFVGAVVVLAWSVVWFADGWTEGERLTQRRYLLTVLITGTLAFGAYFSIKRSDRDAAWRWAAWLCTFFALITRVFGLW